MSENEGLQSLHGESKKIPVNLPNDKLSMSQLSDFARETQYFKNDYKSPGIGQKKANLKINNSIAEVEDEDYMASRGGSRKAARNENKEYSSYNRQVDQLDKLIEQDRGKSRGLDKNNSNHNQWGEMSYDIRQRVEKARQTQITRQGKINAMLSSKELDQVCSLSTENKEMLSQAIEKLGLSARGYYKILKVARTIADINGSKDVNKIAIQEAISYRKMDKFIK